MSFSTSLPVYVWIHGGAFIENGPQLPDGIFENLVNRGPLIIVAVAYRLGPFGFFTTREASVPGNMALTDWIAALTWVQKYADQDRKPF